MTDASSRDLHLERVLDAPPELVFDACVVPERLAEWWGPSGFTSPSVDLDVRPGGTYQITMQPPEGEAFHLRGEFLEVERPRLLAFTFEWEEPDPDDQVTVTRLSFRPEDGGTRIVVDHGPFATEARHALHHAGWTESLERLDAFLSGPRPGARPTS